MVLWCRERDQSKGVAGLWGVGASCFGVEGSQAFFGGD